MNNFDFIKDLKKYRKFNHVADVYAKKVVTGTILACRWVRLACLRHLDDRLNGHKRGLYFDEDKADLALEFFSYLKLWKGKAYKGKEFVLAPHYQFITANLMGWYNKDGYRRFKIAYIEMARKGAKSTYAGGLGAYFFIADGEDGAEVYTAATKYNQAKIVWDNISKLTKKTIFEKYVKYYQDSLIIEATNSKCLPLSSDYKGMDGLDTHFASLDELHAHDKPAVYDLVVDSVGSRDQSLVFIITTAGFNQDGVCYDRRGYLTQVLRGFNAEGGHKDDSFFGMIYTLDTKADWPDLKARDEYKKDKVGVQEDDWTDDNLWFKAMPGLAGRLSNGELINAYEDEEGRVRFYPGYMTKLDDVQQKAKIAMVMPSAQNNFMTKRLDVWTQQATRWIDLILWDANNTRKIYEEE
jgi:phage terminase large subunit-like protein